MAGSVDALVSNTSGATRAGSTPALGTNTPKVGESSDSPFLFGNSGGWGVTDGKHGQVVALFGLHRKLMHRFCDSVDNLLGVQLLL